MQALERNLESEVSGMNWKEFELLAEKAFLAFGWETIRNYRFKMPRMEVDLIAIKHDNAFCVDCKHWRRTVGEATMLRLASQQIKRTQRVLDEMFNLTRAMPMLLTRYDEQLFVLPNRVPVVPIARLQGFLQEWEGYLDRIYACKLPRPYGRGFGVSSGLHVAPSSPLQGVYRPPTRTSH